MNLENIPRRTFLRGVGTMMALPLLEAMLPITALAQSPKARCRRLAFLFVPNGVNMKEWTPAVDGANYTMPFVLQPLEKMRSEVMVLTGLTQHNAFDLGDGAGDHARSSATWLTGCHPRKTSGADIKAGISVDQIAARHFESQTPFASLELGAERGAQAGDCDSGYSCAYSSSISWRGPGTPNAHETDPRAVFERLFGGGDPTETAESRLKRQAYKRSVLDFVADDAKRLHSKLGARDQSKLDEYYTGVREIELRLNRAEQLSRQPLHLADKKPAGIPTSYADHLRLLNDMLLLAFQTDMTRVATVMFANEGTNRPYNEIGIAEGHHDLSHHGDDPQKLEKLRRINQFQISELAYLLDKMSSIKEVDGTLLDNSLVVYGGGISDGNAHNHDNLPILLCGKGGGSVKSGRHVKYTDGTPLNNLFVSLLDRVGIPGETIGDSTGKLKDLL